LRARPFRSTVDAPRLMATAPGPYVRDPLGVNLKQSLYALDSTTIVDRVRSRHSEEQHGAYPE